MKTRKLTEKQIRSLCTAESFEHGRQLFERGMVISCRISDTAVLARVAAGSPEEGRTTRPRAGGVVIEIVRGSAGRGPAAPPGSGHAVVAPLDTARRDPWCACGYGGSGACGHVAAALLHASANFERLSRRSERRAAIVDESLAWTVREQLRDFLASEMKRDESLWKRFLARVDTGLVRDYRGEMDSACARGRRSWRHGERVDLGEFFAAAKESEKRGNLAEAERIYADAADAIAANAGPVLRQGDRDGDYYERAVRGFASCVTGQALGHGGRRRRIPRLLRMLAVADGHLAGACEGALWAVCADRQDLECLADLIDPLIPDGIATGRDPRSYGSTRRLLRAQLGALSRLGGVRLEAFCAKHYLRDPDICAHHVRILNETDPDGAVQAAAEGGRLFQQGDIMEMVIGLYPRSDPKRLEMLRRIFYRTMETRHYLALREESGNWPEEAASIAAHLREAGRFDVLVAALLAEGEYERAAAEAASCGILEVLAMHHASLCPRYPDTYYATYERLAEDFDTAGRDGHRRLAGILKMMKSVPGHEREFADFLTRIRHRHRGRPDLLRAIKTTLAPNRAAI